MDEKENEARNDKETKVHLNVPQQSPENQAPSISPAVESHSNRQKVDETPQVKLTIENATSLLEKEPLMSGESVNKRKLKINAVSDKAISWIHSLFHHPGLSNKLSDENTHMFKQLSDRIVSLKQKMRQSSWILTVWVSVSSFAVIWSGFFSALIFFFSLRFIACTMKIYQMLFGLLCLCLETNNYVSKFGVGFKILAWIPILELNIGRGCLQLLTGTFAMDHRPSLIEWLPGLCLALAGLFNLICGIQCALQIRAFLQSNEGSLWGNDQQDNPNVNKEMMQPSGESSPPESNLRQIHTRFNAIDKNKDNKISKEELASGFETLGMLLSDSELTMIFNVMDTGQKGYIDLYDFETWWLREKNLFTAFLV